MTLEPETSMRRVLEVLRHPAVRKAFPGACREGFTPPMGGRALYLRCGQGFFAYLLHDDYAEVHACLLPGDGGPKATEVLREQFAEILKRVPRIIATPANALARRKALDVGMVPTAETRRGLQVYEVKHGIR